MTDNTYQTKVYHKQGGDSLVVASGGNIDVEYGGLFSTAGDFYLMSGANLNLYSGAGLNVNSGGILSVGASGILRFLSNAYGQFWSGARLGIYSNAAIDVQSGATLSLGNSALGAMWSDSRWAVLSNANFNIASGGILSGGDSALGKFASGFNFYYGSLSAVNALYMGAILLNRTKVVTVTNSAGAGSGVLSTVSIPSRTGHVIIKASGACSQASMQLYSCLLGEELYICCQSDATANSVSVAILASGGGAVGVSLVGVMGSVLSRIRLDFSGQQSCWAMLKAIADGCWAVVNTSPYVAEDANA
jgi:hypothetical protein